jgi:hypothetical protein
VGAADLGLTQGATYTGRFLVAFAYYTTGWQLDLTEEIPTDLHLTPKSMTPPCAMESDYPWIARCGQAPPKCGSSYATQNPEG